MISRCNILSNVIKQLRDIARYTPLHNELKGFSFEYRSLEVAPIRIRCRISTSANTTIKEQVGVSITKEAWRLATLGDFNLKFKYFLKLLTKVNPHLFKGWTRDKFEQLLEQSQIIAAQRAKDKLGAYFLFRKF